MGVMPVILVISLIFLFKYFDSKMDWKIKIGSRYTIFKLYWLVGRHSTLNLAVNKWLLFVVIIKLIKAYGKQLWSCANKSNINVIQHCQNISLRTIIAASQHIGKPWMKSSVEVRWHLTFKTKFNIFML